ncbi:MAG TPA: MarC family protein [Candidatus Acidoferrum sp.]|nr:MarC family protein [Candidatus Acidoferrum sp.]
MTDRSSLARRHIVIRRFAVVIVLILVGLVVFVQTRSIGFRGVGIPQIVTMSIQLFAIINPLSVLPTFLLCTQGLSNVERSRMVHITSLFVIALVLTFALIGQLIINALQITVSSFMLGGGILVMVIAVSMLQGFQSMKLDAEQAALVPIATPLIVGPGTMATLIVLANTDNLINVLVAGMIAAFGVFLILNYSDKIAGLIGNNGVQAVSRLMAIILAAIAASMIHGALLAWGIAKS